MALNDEEQSGAIEDAIMAVQDLLCELCKLEDLWIGGKFREPIAPVLEQWTDDATLKADSLHDLIRKYCPEYSATDDYLDQAMHALSKEDKGVEI